MRYFFLTFLSLCLFSCTPGKKQYFDFDEIDHYQIKIHDSVITKLYNDTLKSKLDLLKIKIIAGNTPKNISDLSFIDKLEEMGFKRTVVDTSKFKAIESIFLEKEAQYPVYMACETAYRNILIFKKNNKVIGTAKICFSCMQSDIKGTTANTDNFGQDGDYAKLEAILKQ